MEAGIRIRQLREKILKRILKNGFERCDFSCAVRFGSGKRTAPAVPEDLGLGSTRLHRTIRLGLGRAGLQPLRLRLHSIISSTACTTVEERRFSATGLWVAQRFQRCDEEPEK